MRYSTAAPILILHTALILKPLPGNGRRGLTRAG